LRKTCNINVCRIGGREAREISEKIKEVNGIPFKFERIKGNGNRATRE